MSQIDSPDYQQYFQHQQEIIQRLQQHVETLNQQVQHLSAPAPASVPASAHAPAHVHVVKEPKPADPVLFNGKAEELNTFLLQVEMIFSLQASRFGSEQAKIQYLGTYLRGPALKSFASYLRHEDGLQQPYANLVQRLKDTFGYINPALEAQNKLQSLRQSGRSVNALIAEFLEHGPDSELNSHALKQYFLQALDYRTRGEVVRKLSPQDDLETTYRVAREVDQQFNILKALNERRSALSASVSASSSGGPEPMVIGRLQKITPEEREELRSTGGCFYCRRPHAGHMASNCPAKTNKAPIHYPSRLIRATVSLSQSSHPAIIDSGAEANVLDRQVARNNQLATRPSANTLTNFDGQTIIDVEETDAVEIIVDGHPSCEKFHVVDCPDQPVVLGIPWLENANPAIDWKDKSIVIPERDSGASIPAKTGISATTATHGPIVQITPRSTKGQSNPGRLSTRVINGITIGIIGKRALRKLMKSQRKLLQLGQLLPRSTQTLDDPTGKNAEPSRDPLHDIPSCYHRFGKVFSEEECNSLPAHTKYDCVIDLTPGADLPSGPIYSLSEDEHKALRTYLDENITRGFIRPSKSSGSSPILFVKKKDGSLRLCVDYRKLNDVTVKFKCPLPLINNCIDRLRNARIFTKLDLRGAYNLLRVKEGDEYKTAFRTQFGLFEYLVMPFGLTNAPSIFQSMVNDLFRQYLNEFVVVYLDDILIYSANPDEHEKHVQTVLEILEQNGLFVKAEKCEFHTTGTSFLGLVISKDGVSMDPAKIKAVQEWESPRSIKGVQSFLGFCNYYRRFMPRYSELALPLTQLTRKNTPFHWSQACEAAFQALKQHFNDEAMLAYPDPIRPYVLETDASDYALGAVLSQEDGSGQLRPIAFHSRKFGPSEINYPVYDKELLAIRDSFATWRHYLQGACHAVRVITDHKNLEHFKSAKVMNRRHARWSLFFTEFDFTIEYRKGELNIVSDALSRKEELHDKNNQPVEFLLPRSSLHINAIRHRPSEAENYVADTTERIRIMQQYHCSKWGGHFGVRKTMEAIRRQHVWPGMKADLEQFVAACPTCARCKKPRQKSQGLLHPLPIPTGAWKSVSLDFISGLPRTKYGYDTCLVVVDRGTKMAHFIPCYSTITAAGTADLFLRHIFRLHGLPDDIVSDRGPQFISKVWKSLWAAMEVDDKRSTAFHPQTDGQTERVNQVLECYLRCYVNFDQNDWDQLLPYAEFSYNNSVHSATKMSPFFANYGYHPRVIASGPRDSAIPTAVELASRFETIHQFLRANMTDAQAIMKEYADRHRQPCTFDVGDEVYLSTKNLKTLRPSDKLSEPFIGPFPIVSKISNTAYRLELPALYRIHDVFHVSLLKPCIRNDYTPPGPSRPNPEVVKGYEEYEVAAILAAKRFGRRVKYLVEWKGYGPEDRTWEPLTHLDHSLDTVREFHSSHPSAPRPASLRP